MKLSPVLFGQTAFYAVLVAAIFGLAGCAAPAFHLVRRAPKTISAEEKARAELYFVKARGFDMFGRDGDALRCYGAAYALDPQSQTLRDILVEKYAQSGQLTRALLLIKSNAKGGRLSDSDKRLCASIYMREGKIGAAADMLRDIREKSADDSYTLGFIEESQGSPEKAAGYFSDFLNKRPESSALWVKVGALYIALKKIDAAESLYVAMERRFGQTPEVFNGIAKCKLARGDTALAINSFKTASLIDSTDTESVRSLAQICMQKGQFEHAIAYYERLYALDNRVDPYGRSLAMLYYYTRHFNEAHGVFDSLLAQNGGDFELHFFNGLALAALDSIQGARREFEKTVEIRGDFSDGWEQLCYLELKAKRTDSALTAAQRFKKRLPQSLESWRIEGIIYAARQEYDKACSSLGAATAIDSTDALSWFELGSALERSREREKSVMAFKRVLRLKPGDGAAANYLGYMWAERGENLDSAQALIAMAVAKDSLNGAYLDSYAWVLFQRGNVDSAFVYIVKALTRITDDPTVYSHYGDILEKRRDTSGAITAYRKALSAAVPDKITDEELGSLREKIERLLKSTPIQGKTPIRQTPSARPARP